MLNIIENCTRNETKADINNTKVSFDFLKKNRAKYAGNKATAQTLLRKDKITKKFTVNFFVKVEFSKL